LIGSTERTVYRYLDLLKAVGFKVVPWYTYSPIT
jgi:hypothetical protein